jgi:hypothetical protein
MNDTSSEAKAKQLEVILSKTQEERILMALQMMDDVRQMVIDGIRSQEPGISEGELKVRFIQQYYKNDVTEEYLAEVVQWIRQKYSQH